MLGCPHERNSLRRSKLINGEGRCRYEVELNCRWLSCAYFDTLILASRMARRCMFKAARKKEGRRRAGRTDDAASW